MKNKINVLLSGLVLCLVTANAPAQTNLIRNGGFEAPAISFYATYTAPASFSNWTVGTGAIDLVTSNLYASASGRQSVDLNATDSGLIFQDVATTPGVVYRLAFQFAGNPLPDNPCCLSPAIKQMNVLWDSTVLGTVQHNAAGHTASNVGWRAYTFSVVGTGTNRLTFRSQTPGSAGSAIDDVSLVAIPSLSIVQLGQDHGTLSWPLWATNFVVEFSGMLSPADWMPLTNPVTTFNNRYEVVVEKSANQSFYRLRTQ